jgi:hypothetical protein
MDDFHEHLVNVNRDPDFWFCSGCDGDGIPRVYGRGQTEAEARDKAKHSACNYRAKNLAHRIMAPLSLWTFTVYPPD